MSKANVVLPPTFDDGMLNANNNASLVLWWGVFSFHVAHKQLA